jgi:hypothetical protein
MSRSVVLLFCPETEFSSDVDRQNSVTSKLFSGQSSMSNGYKSGIVAHFLVFNSRTQSFGNSSIFTFSLLLFTLYRFLYLPF